MLSWGQHHGTPRGQPTALLGVRGQAWAPAIWGKSDSCSDPAKSQGLCFIDAGCTKYTVSTLLTPRSDSSYPCDSDSACCLNCPTLLGPGPRPVSQSGSVVGMHGLGPWYLQGLRCTTTTASHATQLVVCVLWSTADRPVFERSALSSNSSQPSTSSQPVSHPKPTSIDHREEACFSPRRGATR